MLLALLGDKMKDNVLQIQHVCLQQKCLYSIDKKNSNEELGRLEDNIKFCLSEIGFRDSGWIQLSESRVQHRRPRRRISEL